MLIGYSVPGGQLAITYQGKLVYNRGFGYADSATQILVQPNSIFRVASCSKPITSVALMHLLEQGRFHLDDLVFGPSGILNDSVYLHILDAGVYNITVRHLLTHTGGWNTAISGDPMLEAYNIATTMHVPAPANGATIVQYVLGNKYLDFFPGTQFQYSNFGFCVLGRVIEKLTGQPYATYVNDSILKPMGIAEMGQGHNLPANQLPNEVHYYDFPGDTLAYSVYDNVTRVPMPYGGFNVEAQDANGGWVASAADLCKFLVSVDSFPSVPDVLTPTVINTMVTPSAGNNTYALGWEVNAGQKWWHTGSLPGTASEMVRTSQQINWALLFNGNREDMSQYRVDIDNLVWDILPRISTWPVFDLFAGVQQTEKQSGVHLYPVPANEYMHVKIDPSLLPASPQLNLFDEQGRNVYSNSIKTNDYIIPTTKLSSGMYFVQIKGGDYTEIKRIVVQH